MNRSSFVVIALCTAAVLSIAGCGQPTDAKAAAPGAGAPPPPAVAVAPAVMRAVRDLEEFTGRLEAPQSVEIKPRIGGMIEQVHFKDGAVVKAGDLLFTIDPRPYQAEVARSEAQLAAAETAADLARSEVARAQKLIEAKAVSRQEFDQLNSAARTAEANIRVAKAALRVSRLNVDYTSVRAPIAGRMSRANITVGNLVDDKTTLTTLVSTDRVYAYFDGSEQTYLRLRGAGPDQLRVRMALANESGFPHTGRVDFIDNRLNPQTGAIRMRGVFDNAKGEFVPGLFARMQLSGENTHEVVLTPERAIGTDQSKKFVLVASPANTAEFREVKLGALYDGMRVVESGLKPGELVIVNGLQRVRPGAPLTPEKMDIDEHGMPIEKPAAPPAAAKAKS